MDPEVAGSIPANRTIFFKHIGAAPTATSLHRVRNSKTKLALSRCWGAFEHLTTESVVRFLGGRREAPSVISWTEARKLNSHLFRSESYPA